MIRISLFIFLQSMLIGQWFVQNLDELAIDFEKNKSNAKSVAELTARSKGWPLKGKNNERFFELMELDANGLPVYYCTENINSARTISTDDVWPGGDGQLFLTGLGMTVGIWDNGKVRDTHQELAGRVQQLDGATDLGDHATHVGGTLIASGYIYNAHGMAYQAQLDAYDWSNDESEMASAAANGLDISNHSYGTFLGWTWDYFDDDKWAWFGDLEIDSTEDYKFGFYNQAAREWDVIAYNAPDYLIVISAGNERSDEPSTTGIEHWVYSSTDGDWVLSTAERNGDGPWDCLGDKKAAKNVLTVGAVEDIPSGYSDPNQVQLTNFSSVGPLDDGRIKPDIVANGSGLYSSLEGSDSDYGSYWGTSMAAPSAAGSLTLVRQHYETVMDTTIRAATLKGIAIHTADEAGSDTGPDYKFGWGLFNTLKAVNLISAVGDGHDIIEDILAYGDSIEYQFSSTGADPFRATLSWSDPPGTPVSPSLDPSDIMLVHDLDLRIIDPNGQVYFPYKLNKYDPGQAAFTGDNIVDNVEQVYIDMTIPGSYTVRVKHKNALMNDQPFGLIITYGTSIPEMVHVSIDGDDTNADGSMSNPFNTIQAALDFAGMGDTILISPGVYTENIEMHNQNNVLASHFVLDGDTTHISTTIIDGGGQDRVLHMNLVGPSTSLNGLTFQNGYTTERGAGLYCEESYPTITHCIFKENHAGVTNQYTHGGGIAAFESEITLDNVMFSSNYAAGQGGALYLNQSFLSASNLLINNNVSNFKGGGTSFYKSTATLDHVTIVNDSAVVEGGALFLYESEITITNSIIWGSDPQQIAFDENGDPSIININYSNLDGYVNDVITHNNGTVNFGLFDLLNSDPLFCVPDSGDYYLAANSPCVNSGEDGTHMGIYGVGCNEIVSVSDEHNIPRSFKLFSPFPNPFNPSTTIRFNVGNNESVSLKIYDINGRLIDTLLEKEIGPGDYEVSWDAGNMSSGLYIVQLQNKDHVQNQKLILMK